MVAHPFNLHAIELVEEDGSSPSIYFTIQQHQQIEGYLPYLLHASNNNNKLKDSCLQFVLHAIEWHGVIEGAIHHICSMH